MCGESRRTEVRRKRPYSAVFPPAEIREQRGLIFIVILGPDEAVVSADRMMVD